MEPPETNTVSVIDKRRGENIAQYRHILKCMWKPSFIVASSALKLEETQKDWTPPEILENHSVVWNLRLLTTQCEWTSEKSCHVLCYLHVSTNTNWVVGSNIKNIIQWELAKGIKDPKYFCIMADEVTSHNFKQLALCASFVDQSSNIRAELISFSDVPRITGEHLAHLPVLVYKQVIRNMPH